MSTGLIGIVAEADIQMILLAQILNTAYKITYKNTTESFFRSLVWINYMSRIQTTYISIFVFAFCTAADITQVSDVLFLEPLLIV